MNDMVIYVTISKSDLKALRRRYRDVDETRLVIRWISNIILKKYADIFLGSFRTALIPDVTDVGNPVYVYFGNRAYLELEIHKGAAWYQYFFICESGDPCMPSNMTVSDFLLGQDKFRIRIVPTQTSSLI